MKIIVTTFVILNEAKWEQRNAEWEIMRNALIFLTFGGLNLSK